MASPNPTGGGFCANIGAECVESAYNQWLPTDFQIIKKRILNYILLLLAFMRKIGNYRRGKTNIGLLLANGVDRSVRIQSRLTKFYKKDQETLYRLVLVTIKWLIQNLLGGSV
jgi:hypothetical protein